MARGPSKAPSPVAIAIETLAKLSAAGTNPARMERAARSIVAEWRATADPDIAQRWTGELLADVANGLAHAEEQAGDTDSSEPAAVKHAQATVDALRATHATLTTEMRHQ